MLYISVHTQVITSREVAAIMLYVNRASFLRIGFGEAAFTLAFKVHDVYLEFLAFCVCNNRYHVTAAEVEIK